MAIFRLSESKVLMFWSLSNKCFLETISSQISSLSSYDLFTQEKVIPKKLDLREVILTPEQYAAMTPESLKDSNN
ncbi:MAG: hypothetical protein IM539_07175 [Pseudanabaena sp. M046S1SP1A06QC]|nr:hypothetical protein [Pseudanabaena sp. M046S1SP1A06QC]